MYPLKSKILPSNFMYSLKNTLFLLYPHDNLDLEKKNKIYSSKNVDRTQRDTTTNMAMDNENAIVLNFNDSLLRKSDVDLLDGPCWINDKLIAFCFE